MQHDNNKQISPGRVSKTATKNIFRDFHGTKLFLEKSAIPRSYGFISKNQTDNVGYPDFFLDEGLIFVVEAKTTNHESAVEELLFYMENNSFSNQRDCIGIAVSGQNTRKHPLQVSYFIKFAVDSSPIELNIDKSLLSVENLEKVYLKQKKEKYANTLDNLTKTLSSLNSQFQKDNIVRDTERSLFFSGLMIALKDLTLYGKSSEFFVK